MFYLWEFNQKRKNQSASRIFGWLIFVIYYWRKRCYNKLNYYEKECVYVCLYQ